MGRISRDVMFMDMARAASRRSTCFRLNVGAIVTTLEHNPIAAGWNGQAPGAAHCAGNDCPGITPGNCGTLHAEANAVNKASALLQTGTQVNVYATHSPCAECSLLLRESKISIARIFFEVPYRSTQHLSMFADRYPDPEFPGQMRMTGVYEVTAAGYIVDYFSRRVVELP